MAEALAKRILKERGRTDIAVSSAGTAAFDGAPASEAAYLVGIEHGLDLSDHRARSLTSELVGEADLLLCMSPHHLERAEELGGMGKAHLLGAYAGRRPGDTHVDDPFGGDLEEYRATFATLQSMLSAALDRLLREERDASTGDQ
jgi:protein-tyrosine-phosphatase